MSIEHFGAPADLETKDLAAQGKETRVADGRVTVEMVHHWRTSDGRNVIPGETVDLAPSEAASLVAATFAVYVD